MKPEEQRIAIAEACGWTCADYVKPEDKIYALMCWVAPGDDPWHLQAPPDYLSDLNAMHEAEKVLTEEQHRRFSWHLVQVTDDNYRTWSAFEYETLSVWEMSLGDVQACLRATAAHRAEAFLRTLKLWTSS